MTSVAQILNVPPRPAGAPNGTQFTNIVTTLSRDERENWIYAQVISGNVPGWLRALKPISVSAAGHTATYHVIPEYLAIGSDTDYFLAPTTPLLAQRLGDRLSYALPTRKMVNQIWTNAAVKLAPAPIAPSAEMITVPVFAQHNAMVRAQRDALTNSQPLGALVSGDKKDVVISSLIYSNLQAQAPKPVVIYGWHYASGSPIQPLYNGHEETYADYSHGARLVQMNLTVDGVPNTVTNVLVSPTLATLLSDETVAPSFTIPLPRYTVAPLAPSIITHPRSQSAPAGTTVTFASLTIGDLPRTYHWQFNGGDISGATNSTFSLTNTLAADAGSYRVVVAYAAGSATNRVAALRVRTNAWPTLFADNFDTDTSTNWSVFWGAADGIADYTVDWAFDYGAIPYTFNGITALIPPAPNSTDGSTRAVRLSVNGDASGQTAAVNLYPKNQFFSGNFALKFDLWIQYPGNAGGTGPVVTGSTQHGIFGLNHLGTNVNWAAPASPASDGLWFAVSGEGGDSRDCRAYVGNLAGLPTDLTATLSASNHTAAMYQMLFPAARFETVGAPGKNWTEVELRYTNHLVAWLLDGTLITQRTNTSSFSAGNIMIGLMDVFPSIASPARDSFLLVDNLRVENLSPPPIWFQSATRLSGGEISLRLTNVPGDNYWLEVSSDLLAWQLLAIVVATNATFTFLDASAPAFASRYYRARR